MKSEMEKFKTLDLTDSEFMQLLEEDIECQKQKQ